MSNDGGWKSTAGLNRNRVDNSPKNIELSVADVFLKRKWKSNDRIGGKL